MSRKPVHMEAAGPRSDRQAIWEAVRILGKIGPFTTADVRGQLHGRTPLGKVREYLNSLAAAGHMVKLPNQGVASYTQYRLIKDTGIDAPRVRADGSEVTQGQGREQLWRGMKILGEFSAADLIHAAAQEIKLSDAKQYASYLHKAGYLVVTGKPSTHGGLTRYRLLQSQYTGPKPPMIQRVKQVYDPNLGRVVWPLEAGHE